MLTDSQISELINRTCDIISNTKAHNNQIHYEQAFSCTLNYLIDVEDAKTRPKESYHDGFTDDIPRIYGSNQGIPLDPMAQAEVAGQAMQDALRAQGIHATFVPGFNPFQPRNAVQSNSRVVGPAPKEESPKGPNGPLTEQEKADLLKE
jgi:nitroreductase